MSPLVSVLVRNWFHGGSFVGFLSEVAVLAAWRERWIAVFLLSDKREIERRCAGSGDTPAIGRAAVAALTQRVSQSILSSLLSQHTHKF